MALDDMTTPQEEKHRQRGMVISIVLHILLLVLALLPFLTYPDPPPGQEGILVNLGEFDVGQGEENAGPAEPIAEAEIEEPEPEPLPEEPEPEPEPEREVEKPKPAPTKEKEVVTTEDPEAIALRKQREEEERQRREEARREEEARRKAEAERKAQEDAERKRQQEEARKQAEADKLKNEIGGLFGEGKGKGNTGKPGNQGDPEGDPNAEKLEGVSTGSGQVGGGLSNRGRLYAPQPEDSSQGTGTVVIEVCVNAAGDVISTDFTQRGSTTNNAELVGIATANAKKWKFSKGEVDKQCGTITYNFRVR